MQHSGDNQPTHLWRPDVQTLEWALGIVDEDAVGESIDYFLAHVGRGPGAPTLGEIAAEAVLQPLITLAQNAAQLDPSEIVHGAPADD